REREDGLPFARGGVEPAVVGKESRRAQSRRRITKPGREGQTIRDRREKQLSRARLDSREAVRHLRPTQRIGVGTKVVSKSIQRTKLRVQGEQVEHRFGTRVELIQLADARGLGAPDLRSLGPMVGNDRVGAEQIKREIELAIVEAGLGAISFD